MKSHHRVILLSSLLPMLAACGTVALSGNTGAGSTASTSTSATASADLQTAITQFLGLTADQQVSLAKAMGNLDLLDWSQQNAAASTDSRKTSFTALLASKPAVATALQAGLKASGGQGSPGGPGGAPPQGGMGGPGGPVGSGGPGGLPPNIEEIRTTYPELATALESMQSLTPDERRTQMDALLQAHPEWQSVLMMPAGGPGGMGGPGGSPPPGGFGGPGGSPPPGGFGGPGGSPPPGFQPGAMPSASPLAS